MSDNGQKHKRVKLRFGIRSLLILMLVCGLVVGWFSARIGEVNRENKIRESLLDHELVFKEIKRDLYSVEKVFGRKFYPDHYSIACPADKVELLPEAGKLKHVWEMDISTDAPGQGSSYRPLATDSLDCIESLSELKKLQYDAQPLRDISAIKKLTSLEDLSLTSRSEFSLQPLSELKNLKKLELRGDGLKDFEALGKLSRLESVTLGSSNLKSLDFLKNCKSLKTLHVRHCDPQCDVSQLSNFNSLKSLSINGTVLARHCSNGGTCDVRTELRIWSLGSESLGKIKVSAPKRLVIRDQLKNLEGIENFSDCEEILLDGFFEDISALRKLSNSDVKLILFTKWMRSKAKEVSTMDSLLPGIRVYFCS